MQGHIWDGHLPAADMYSSLVKRASVLGAKLCHILKSVGSCSLGQDSHAKLTRAGGCTICAPICRQLPPQVHPEAGYQQQSLVGMHPGIDMVLQSSACLIQIPNRGLIMHTQGALRTCTIAQFGGYC